MNSLGESSRKLALTATPKSAPLDLLDQLKAPSLKSIIDLDTPALKLEDKCGVAAVIINPKGLKSCEQSTTLATELVYQFMQRQQHRGKHAAGFSIQTPDGRILSSTWLGSVAKFNPATIVESDQYQSYIACGHNRYSTEGSAENLENAQPLSGKVRIAGKAIDFSLSHNGNITNHKELLAWLSIRGKTQRGNSDSGLVVALCEWLSENYEFRSEAELVHIATQALHGSYSFIFQFPDRVVAARDPHGNRPFHFATDLDGSYFLFSETCAVEGINLNGFDINSLWFGEIQPSEVITFQAGQTPIVFSTKSKYPESRGSCGLEDVYMARANSAKSDLVKDGAEYIILADRKLHKLESHLSYLELRRVLGENLADNHQDKFAEAAAVTPIPNSGIPYAEGISNRLNIKFLPLLQNNHHPDDRSFQGATNLMQSELAKTKYSLLDECISQSGINLKDQTLIFVDDSIVRGTTLEVLTPIFNRLREKYGLKKIIFASAFPPVQHHCPYGIAIKSDDKFFIKQIIENLLADPQHLRNTYSVDSVVYLDKERLKEIERTFGRSPISTTEPDLKSVSQSPGICTGCVDEIYPPTKFDRIYRGSLVLEELLKNLRGFH